MFSDSPIVETQVLRCQTHTEVFGTKQRLKNWMSYKEAKKRTLAGSIVLEKSCH